MKTANEKICFQEIPDEISLGLFISNCPNKCPNCHSPYLREDCGKDVFYKLPKLIREYYEQITCVLFMGGDDEKQIEELIVALGYCKSKNIKTALYSGFDKWNEDKQLLALLDYYKVGSYKEECGGLDKPTTNQKLYKKENGEWKDITSRFWTSDIIK